jgi:glycosyltransferase involved in cell wall biosynthesis
MNLSLIICTYERPKSLIRLLRSVENQSLIPDEIIIIDGSKDNSSEISVVNHDFNLSIRYFLVEDKYRGLTKQRNYGIEKISKSAELVSFLDDDIVLETNYFEEIHNTFNCYDRAIGVGGIDLEENLYEPINSSNTYSYYSHFVFDGWVRQEPTRYKLLKYLGLMTDLQPDLIPEYSHGRSGLPPTGKVYKVEHFMGGIATYRKDLLKNLKFSTYFEGYGLYEDFDFCVRALSFGELFVNTSAQVWHLHDPNGRPNKFEYGKMVVRNGWYVWKQHLPNNSIKAKFKWHAIEVLLAQIRFINFLTGPEKAQSLSEYFGRIYGWVTLWINPPRVLK